MLFQQLPFGFAVALPAPLRRLIAKHQDHSEDPSGRVANRGPGVADGDLAAVARAQHGVVGQPHDHAFPQDARYGRFHRLAGLLVNDAKDFLDGSAVGFFGRPTGQTLGHRVHEIHPAMRVRGQNGVPDALEDRLETRLGLGDRGRGTNRFRQKPHQPAAVGQGHDAEPPNRLRTVGATQAKPRRRGLAVCRDRHSRRRFRNGWGEVAEVLQPAPQHGLFVQSRKGTKGRVCVAHAAPGVQKHQGVGEQVKPMRVRGGAFRPLRIRVLRMRKIDIKSHCIVSPFAPRLHQE